MIKDLYYTIQNVHSEKMMDGNSNKKKIYQNENNNEDYQRWLFIKNGDYYEILNKSSQKAVDANNDKKEIYQNNKHSGSNQLWKLIKLENGNYNLENKETKLFIDGDRNGDKIYQNKRNHKDFQEWKIEITADEWTFLGSSLEYEETMHPVSKHPIDIMSDEAINNDSPAKVTETISKEIRRSSSFEWGLTQTLKVGSKVSIEAGVPGLASATAEMSIELGLEAHQKWSTTTQEVYGFSRTIELDKKAKIKVNATIDWVDNLSTDFILKTWIFAKADSVSGSNWPLSTEQIKCALKDDNQFDEKIKFIDEEKANKLLVEIKGTFIGSYGMNTRVDIKEIK